MTDKEYAYQMQFWTPAGDQYIGWVRARESQIDEYIERQERRYNYRLDELWKYELTDPRVNTVHNGLIVNSMREGLRGDFLTEIGYGQDD
jgi:hypothetical protein